jgi:hypothetical protein
MSGARLVRMTGAKMIVFRTAMALLSVMIAAGLPAHAAETGTRAAAGPPAAFQEKATLLSRVAPGETLFPISVVLSGDTAHVAYAAKEAGGMFAVMDDQRSQSFAGIAKGTPLFAGGRFHWAFIAYESGKKARAFIDGRPEPPFDGIDRFLFSPDGSRWAYRAGIGAKQAVVANGVAGPLFDVILAVSGPVFSPDGRRMAYGAMNGRDGFLIVDGRRASVDGIVESLVFSPNAERLAYALKKGNQMRVVCNGRTGPLYESVAQVTFSPDSRRLAYMARREGRWMAVLDGKELAGGDAVGMPLFSPDSRHLAYAVYSGRRWRMVADGEKGPAYQKIGVYVYSPDSKRLAYMAQIDDASACIVVNDAPGKVYNAVGMPVFSPDGAQLAFRARLDQKWFIVQNARPQPVRYKGVWRPVFSPDSRHLVYVGIDVKRMVVVFDEHPLGAYDSATSPFFSPRGKHVAYAGCLRNQWRVYVDGRPGRSVFDATLKEGAIAFSSESRCHIILLKMPGPEFWRLNIDLPPESSSMVSSVKPAGDRPTQ